jgi:hypothetical protein
VSCSTRDTPEPSRVWNFSSSQFSTSDFSSMVRCWKVWGCELRGWSLELKSPAGLECPVTHQKTDGNVSSVFTQYKRLLELWDRYKIIIHKSRGDQFLWNRNWDFCWFWAISQCWKKKFGPIMSNFWRHFFYVFIDKKHLFKKILYRPH